MHETRALAEFVAQTQCAEPVVALRSFPRLRPSRFQPYRCLSGFRPPVCQSASARGVTLVEQR